MTRETCKWTAHKVYSALKTGFDRIEQLEKENQLGLAHTCMREQLNSLMEIVDYYTYYDIPPYNHDDWEASRQLISDKKKVCSWIGYL